MEEAIFDYGLLAESDKKLVDDLIHRLLPKDDEPVTDEDREAIREAKAAYAKGDITPL